MAANPPKPPDGRIEERLDLRDATSVFADRTEAGRTLAEMLRDRLRSDAIVLAVPAGGVPVAAEIARRLDLPLDALPASKITPPGNTEFGYGAVAFDGEAELNEDVLPRLHLRREQIEAAIEEARRKVRRRNESLRDGRDPPEVSSRPVLLVDDGLATGITMRVAVAALRRRRAGEVIVAVPTAHRRSAESIAAQVDALYCPNVRSGYPYAVAEAYRQWRDVPESEAAEILRQFREEDGGHQPVRR